VIVVGVRVEHAHRSRREALDHRTQWHHAEPGVEEPSPR
jgi:hypothetical protein